MPYFKPVKDGFVYLLVFHLLMKRNTTCIVKSIITRTQLIAAVEKQERISSLT